MVIVTPIGDMAIKIIIRHIITLTIIRDMQTIAIALRTIMMATIIMTITILMAPRFQAAEYQDHQYLIMPIRIVRT